MVWWWKIGFKCFKYVYLEWPDWIWSCIKLLKDACNLKHTNGRVWCYSLLIFLNAQYKKCWYFLGWNWLVKLSLLDGKWLKMNTSNCIFPCSPGGIFIIDESSHCLTELCVAVYHVVDNVRVWGLISLQQILNECHFVRLSVTNLLQTFSLVIK